MYKINLHVPIFYLLDLTGKAVGELQIEVPVPVQPFPNYVTLIKSTNLSDPTPSPKSMRK